MGFASGKQPDNSENEKQRTQHKRQHRTDFIEYVQC